MVKPEPFHSVAEESGLIVELGNGCCTACRQTRR